MIFLCFSQNGGLGYIRIKRRSELSGYELTGVDCRTKNPWYTSLKISCGELKNRTQLDTFLRNHQQLAQSSIDYHIYGFQRFNLTTFVQTIIHSLGCNCLDFLQVFVGDQAKFS